MTSDFYFTVTSWFPENGRVKPYSKYSALPAWTVFIPWAWTKTDIFDPLPPHLFHVVIEWPLIELSSMMDAIEFKRMLVTLVERSEAPKQLKKLELYLHTFYVKSDDGKNISFLLGGSLNDFFEGVCIGDSGSPLMRYDMITDKYELGKYIIKSWDWVKFFWKEHSYSYAPVVSHFTSRYTNNISY